MDKSGAIIIIDDDLDDRVVIGEILKELNVRNEVVYFANGVEAYEYLGQSKKQPFLILSDINMPKLNGFELMDKVNNNEQLRLKCTPFLFFTTSSEPKTVVEAYSKSVQGFFVKPPNFSDLRRVINNIIEYWKDCQAPNIDSAFRLGPYA